MNATTSIRTLQENLQDYKLHLSAFEPPVSATAKPVSGDTIHQPTNWPSDYRRIPPYRPINKNLDLSERPNGSNKGELVFVTVMMNGVRLQSGLVRAWEQTGGRWYPQLTQYKIGGEW